MASSAERMCRETVRKVVCAETFPERVAYPPRSQMMMPLRKNGVGAGSYAFSESVQCQWGSCLLPRAPAVKS